MSYSITNENFESLTGFFNDPGLRLIWEPLFVTPVFMKAWWDVFGAGNSLYFLSVRDEEGLIGIAPLMRKDGEASFAGNPDVCDYFDFIIVPGKEQEFFESLLGYLKLDNVITLDLRALRPDSTVVNYLVETAISKGCEVTLTPNDVSSEMVLPGTWEDYLQYLNTKQRHEVRRKLRRLEEAGEVRYIVVGNPEQVRNDFEIFLRLFMESRTDKAEFLTEQRETFFRKLAESMSEAGIFKLGKLELDSVPAAMIIYFDYNDRIYLYNSGFETSYTSLSIGLLSKVLSIRDSIESGKKSYDFLKGDEIYKSRLGGNEIKLTDCRITLR